MLRASLLTDAKILPQARQGRYFFNRIGHKQTFGSDYEILGGSTTALSAAKRLRSATKNVRPDSQFHSTNTSSRVYK